MAHQPTRILFAIAVLVLAVATSTTAHAQGFSVLHDFLGTNSGDGCNPTYSGIVAQGRDGNMYGTTYAGGAPSFTNNVGSVFQVTPAGALTLIHSFRGDETEGWYPFGGLTLGTDGYFYGTTKYYGPSGGSPFGAVFQITPGGGLTYPYIFQGGTDGRYPTAPPIQGIDGNWYGTTQGDFSNPGSVYKLTLPGTLTVLHSFVHGEQPQDPLVQATDGNFYGTTHYGGTSNNGSVFRITPDGKKFTVIYNFDTTHGQAPYAPLIQGADGNFYGTTTSGGSAGGGVVFKLTPARKITVLYNFIQGDTPSVPIGGLVQATDGFLYGTTSEGNSQGGITSNGTIFRISGKKTSTPSYLHDFDQYPTGRGPQDTLLQDTNGILYGDTIEGGVPNVGCGVFYQLNQGLNPFVSLLFISGKVGDSIGILGQGFTGTTSVSFNGAPAAFTLDPVTPDTYLTATVPSGTTKGKVTVVSPTVNLTSNKVFNVVPFILSFNPTSGKEGDSVVITGSGLTQASKVTFGGGKAATFTVNSDSQVTATVPTGAKTGKIVITTPGGTATSSGTFTVTS
jgi:uncharacterized repeat protein (TIGR03803 family)